VYQEHKQLHLPSIDAEIRQFWQDERVFERSVEQRDPARSFVFYEGPPSANGLPGIHHVMARTVKDVFCRYQTLKGHRVERKGGWDTHGLPIELQVEKELGITKEDIGKKISVDEYNQACRATVMRYKDLWDDITRRMGYWVDLNDPYITFDNNYIESVWWLLSRLYQKNLLYKGYTIQPYSPAAGTGLSTHELNQPGCYRDVTDTSAVAMFRVRRGAAADFLFENADDDVRILAWTTTPWTLPSNTALSVGPDIEYVAIRCTVGERPVRVVLAKALTSKWFGGKNQPVIESESAPFLGSQLQGIDYEQLMPFGVVPDDGDAFKVITGDFVTTEDGTGVVHTAPSFGADDMRVARQHGIGSLTLVDRRGRFLTEVQDGTFLYGEEYVKEDYLREDEKAAELERQKEKLAGFIRDTSKLNYLSVDERIALKLQNEGKLFKKEKYVHSYPHCWRTDKPVLYYPLDSWFVRASDMKEKMFALNQTINWKPASTGDSRFGKWLENLQDWNLSRSRYWGVPLPIWRSADGSEEICISSVAQLGTEIERANAALGLNQLVPNDLHRPYIDEVTLVSASGQPMRRELDLIDVWFDSGSMPFAQWHFPFENVEKFAQNYPADFIAEGVDQTRGWFYTLHAISTMVQDEVHEELRRQGVAFDAQKMTGVAYRNVVSNGLVLDKSGNKMSKSKGNVVSPFETIDQFGADATRWYMLANASPWDNLKFDSEGIIETRNKYFGTLFNTYNFFALYANLDGWKMDEQNVLPYAERTELDRWVISKLYSTVAEYRAAMDDYEPTKAARALETFVDEHLSNWYVRLSRRRFWKPSPLSAGEGRGAGLGADKQAAYQTLFECLMVTAQLSASLAPFFSDWLYRNLTAPIRDAAIRHQTPLRHSSVHLTDLVQPDASKVDADLERRMDYAQRICSLAFSIRKKEKIRVRLPLQKVLLPVLNDAFMAEVDGVKDLILSEINVKQLEYVTDASGLLTKAAKANFKTLGAKLGKDMKAAADLIANLSSADITTLERNGEWPIEVAGNQYVITPDDLVVTTDDLPGWKVASDGPLTVALDVQLTPELQAEGLARDLVNRIQNLRKESDFQVTDRIVVHVERHPAIEPSVAQFGAYIRNEVLADVLTLVDAVAGEPIELNDEVAIGLEVRLS
jgi:isoleucyl-tRNA synthetase